MGPPGHLCLESQNTGVMIDRDRELRDYTYTWNYKKGSTMISHCLRDWADHNKVRIQEMTPWDDDITTRYLDIQLDRPHAINLIHNWIQDLEDRIRPNGYRIASTQYDYIRETQERIQTSLMGYELLCEISRSIEGSMEYSYQIWVRRYRKAYPKKSKDPTPAAADWREQLSQDAPPGSNPLMNF